MEQQFYIAFPFIYNALISTKIFFVITLILSYSYSLLSWLYNPSFSYFDFFSRVWEFFYGIIPYEFTQKKKNSLNSNFLILFIISLLFVKNIDKVSPPFSIIPLSITLLIINKENHEYFFSIRLFHHLGNISYCFYLFHYILINALFISKNEYINISICFTFTYLISYFFTFYYEIPLRNKITNIYFQTSVIIFFHSLLLLFTINMLSNDSKKLKKVNNEIIAMTYGDVLKEWLNLMNRRDKCPFPKRSKQHVNIKNVALFITDSHVEQWFNIIMPYIYSNNYIPIHIYAREFNVIKNQQIIIKKLLDRLLNIKVIIIGYFINSTIVGLKKLNFEKYVRLLLNYTKLIYIFQDTPHFLKNPNECLTIAKDYNYCFAILDINATINLIPIIKDKRIKYINMNDYICNKNKYCYFIINKIIVYKDNHHLSIQFANSLSKYLLKQFSLIKLNSTNCKNNKWYTCLGFYYFNYGKIKENEIS